MPFNSIPFCVFFILFTGIFYLLKNNNSKILLLIAGSWFFYSYLNIFNLINLLFTTVVTFIIATQIKRKSNNKPYLIVGILLIVMQLVITKYSSELANLLEINYFSETRFFNYLGLPIGISFYSLQAIGLLIDIRNKNYEGDLRFKSISLFLSLFPQSISGPIHRAKELLPQFIHPSKFRVDNVVIGFKTMLWGYFCKLIVADKISIIITPVFNAYFEQDGLSITIASLLYSLQIYFDFWGYSLIAIGAGRILGFTININFNAPYLATSFREFWHRWHITLSKWMRDYIYIPIGGRKQKGYTLFLCSIFITFLVSGFWHGITTNFILWGATHATLYLIEDLVRRQQQSLPSFVKSYFALKFIRSLKIVLFFVVISLTWLIFRTNNILELEMLFKKMATISNWSVKNVITNYLTMTNVIYFIIIILALFLTQTNFLKQKTETMPYTKMDTITDSAFICFCSALIILLGDVGGQEFLYFRF